MKKLSGALAVALILALPVIAQEMDEEAIKTRSLAQAIQMTEEFARCNGIITAVAAGFTELPGAEHLGEATARFVSTDSIERIAPILEIPMDHFFEIENSIFEEALLDIMAPDTDAQRSEVLNRIMKNDLGPCIEQSMWAETQIMLVLTPVIISRHLEDEANAEP